MDLRWAHKGTIDVEVNGLDLLLAQRVGEVVEDTFHFFQKGDQALDLRRMKRVIVTTDLPAQLAGMFSSTGGDPASPCTLEAYARAVGKVVIVPRRGDFEILPVLDADWILPLAESGQRENGGSFRAGLHFLHHEFAHVHDNNKKMDTFGSEFMKTRDIGKDLFIRPLARSCWNEFIANCLSAATADDELVLGSVERLMGALAGTKKVVDAEIRNYRLKRDIQQLMARFQRHGEYLPKSAAYVLGYLRGKNAALEDVSEKAARMLQGSYFEPIWKEMNTAFATMLQKYPQHWRALSIYDQLSEVLERYYGTMGLVLSTTADARTSVAITGAGRAS